MSEKMLFADVILSLHLPYAYAYRVPDALMDEIKIGQRVVVPLRNRIYSAIVVNLYPQTPKISSLRYILDIVDLEPTCTHLQIKFFKWIADYYISYVGDVLTAALPSVFRLKSETVLRISPQFSSDISELNEQEIRLVDIISAKEKIKFEDIQLEISREKLLKMVEKLINADVLVTDEELYNKYVPKKVATIRLNEKYQEAENFKQLLTDLDNSQKTSGQSEIILQYKALLRGRSAIKRSELEQKGCNHSTIDTLIRKEIFIKGYEEISRLQIKKKSKEVSAIILNEEQQNAYDNIINEWDSKPITLIHGVTGSGKTEIYVKLIDKVLKEGGQVLYLLPEIAVSVQLVSRLEQYFGEQIALYNSKFSTFERAEIWNRTHTSDKNRRFNLIVGSRSAVFLPFLDLRLVIIDEEHDTSFKQTEPVPHYNGRDSALYLAQLFKAKAVLGSATPNVETYKLALEGKYQLVELKHQYYNLPLPAIEIVDLRECIKNNQMHGIFSSALYDAITKALENKHQVIIFQNRRGYAPHIECNVCGYVPKCPNCDVSLVLHKESESMVCHYCGFHTEVMGSCPDCHSYSMRIVGTGTEKIEEELQSLFPSSHIQRMDLDSTRKKNAISKIISDFSNRKTDILCGTQIVSKGLNFENVALVGVIGADSLLHYPEFRAFERAFQILTQVSGRAGRKNAEGRVIIQTYDKNHPILLDVQARNYLHMYQMQLKERELMNFPPYCKMIKLTLQHSNRAFVENKSIEYAKQLKIIFGSRLFGPQEPIIARIKNQYFREIWLKIEKNISYSAAKLQLKQYTEAFLSKKENSSLRINVDVDPL